MARTPEKGRKAIAAKPRWGDGRVAFLAHRDAIEAWLATGKTLREFYDTHRDQLAVSYSQIVRHAGQHIPGFKRTRHVEDQRKPTPTPVQSGRPLDAPSRPPGIESKPSTLPSVERRGFTHTPEPLPDSELF